jgi:predicted TIM-barrel fold metal-dependent hydrolase
MTDVLHPTADPASNRLCVIDCDVHPKTSPARLKPFLSRHWQDYLDIYGLRPRHGFSAGYPYPKGQPQAARRDAWPPGGGLPASDLAFMREQLLDFYDVEYAILNFLSPTGQGAQNIELSTALAFACNEAHRACWTGPDKRLKASIVVPYEDGEASAKEIDRVAGKPDYAQVQLLSRMSELAGKKRYWPIYEAASAHGLPVGIHVFGYSGWASTNGGWASYYIEEMAEHATSCQSLLTSLVVEGVFERFPKLRIVLVEAGLAWLPALGFRLDKHWKKLKSEVPHLKRAPSEYIREHVYVTTQPMEEPEQPEHLIEVMEWIGWDHILFATDYPHWDFDDPRFALPKALTGAQRRMILSENARSLYGFA